MRRGYRPKEMQSCNTPLHLLIPTYVNDAGKVYKTYDPVGAVFFASFKTYGGTESTNNGLIVIEDTANIATWYRDDIKSDCRIKRISDGAVYEILGEPEDIDQQHMYLKFKVKRLKGGA